MPDVPLIIPGIGHSHLCMELLNDIQSKGRDIYYEEFRGRLSDRVREHLSEFSVEDGKEALDLTMRRVSTEWVSGPSKAEFLMSEFVAQDLTFDIEEILDYILSELGDTYEHDEPVHVWDDEVAGCKYRTSWCQALLVLVEESPFFVYGVSGWPCYAGKANFDSPGQYACYCPPPGDWDHDNRFTIYSAITGEVVVKGKECDD